MSTIYGSPELYGLEQVAMIDFSDSCYCFDCRVVWREKSTGKLLSGRDSGCSCPSPFQSVSVSDLQEVESVGWLKEEIRMDERGNLSSMDAASFIETVEKALHPQWGGRR